MNCYFYCACKSWISRGLSLLYFKTVNGVIFLILIERIYDLMTTCNFGLLKVIILFLVSLLMLVTLYFSPL